MSPLWLGIAGLALLNFALKAAAPLFLAGRTVPPRASAVIDALGQCLLASLVVVALVGRRGTGLDAAVVAGVALAALLRLAGRHELVCVGGAVAVVAALRLVL